MEYNRGNTDHARFGDHWVICDVCGQKTWFSDTRLTWKNTLACLSRGCWYPKHPADDPLPVISDPFALPSNVVRADYVDWSLLPSLIMPGVSSWDQILPPFNTYTWDLQKNNWDTFDDGDSWYTGDQTGP